MSKRTIAAIVAVLLALMSGFLVLSYAGSADVRAMKGQKPTYVVVAAVEIPKGTPAKDLKDMLEVITIPAVGVAPGAMSRIDDVLGFGEQVTDTQITAGEQVIASRFITLDKANTVSVPPGMQEVSLALKIERAVGGRLKPGSKIGVLISIDDPRTTTMALTNILVTKVEPVDDKGVIQPSAPPSGKEGETITISGYLITLAMGAADAEELGFGLEHGRVWLTLQNDETSHDGRRIVTHVEVKP